MPQIRVLEVLEATTGGTRRHLNDLVTGLNPKLFRVSVLCSVLRDRTFLADVQRMRKTGIHVNIVPMVRSISPIRDLFALLAIWRHLRRHDYEIVHTHSSKAGFLGRLAVKLAHASCAVIHTPHVFPFQMAVGQLSRVLFFSLERLAARHTDIIICICRSQIDAAQSLLPSQRGRVALVANGVPAEAFEIETSEVTSACRREWGFGRDEIVIGHVGRFTAQKAHHVLIAAMARVVEEVPKARLVMVGDGPYRDRVASRIRRLGLENYCRILGERENLKSFYSAIDIFALPSLWEGLPYALLEAMAAQRPVVATRTGGIPDAVQDGINGLLVPCGDVEALARGLIHMAASAPLRNSYGSAARETVATKFRLEDMIAGTEKVYLASLDRMRRRG